MQINTTTMEQIILEQIKEALRNTDRFMEDEVQNVLILKENEDSSFDVEVPMTTRAFIERVLIKEMGQVVKISPWLGFIGISSAIEFLGKCIDTDNPMSWNKPDRSRVDFEAAIMNLNGLNRFKELICPKGLTKEEKALNQHFDIYSELRCGLLHAFAPKSKISLSHGSHEQATTITDGGSVNFNADELYEEFKLACEDVIAREYAHPNKMNYPKISVFCRIVPKSK